LRSAFPNRPRQRSETNANRPPSGEYSGRDSAASCETRRRGAPPGDRHGPDVTTRDDRELRPVWRDSRFGKRRRRFIRRCRRLHGAGRPRRRDGRDMSSPTIAPTRLTVDMGILRQACEKSMATTICRSWRRPTCRAAGSCVEVQTQPKARSSSVGGGYRDRPHTAESADCLLSMTSVRGTGRLVALPGTDTVRLAALARL